MRPPRPRLRPVTGLLVVLVLLGACGSGSDAAAPTPPPPPWFEPPVAFAPESGRLFGESGTRLGTGGGGTGLAASAELPATLSGDTVWLTVDGRLEHADAQGRATPVALPPGRSARGRPVLDPPEAASAPGTAPERVLAAAAAVVPGVGTTPPGLAAELHVVDPGTRTVAGAVALPLSWTARPDAVRMRVLGPFGGTGDALPGSTGSRSLAVLSAATDAQRTTAGVDLASGRVLWVAEGVEAAVALDDGGGPGAIVATATPAGSTASYTPSDVVVLDAATGARTAVVAEGVRGPTVAAAGPALAAVGARAATTSLFGTGAVSLRLVGPDGRTVGEVDPGDAFAPPRCVWDSAAVTVCATESTVTAVDATDGAVLWSLPDPGANRVAPSITGAWRGAVYGTTVNGPVVLDARTGADREARPGAAPALVNGRIGLALSGGGVGGFGGRVSIHPALR